MQPTSARAARPVTVAAALLAGLMLCSGSALAQATGVPATPRQAVGDRLSENAQITFDKTDHDFGNIADTSNVRTKFRFTNTGSGPLTIYSAQGSCGCTVPNVMKDGEPNTFPATFEPGESGEIVVQFDPRNRQGDQAKHVTIRTSAATNPSVRLNLRSLVIPIVVAEPAVVQLLDLEKGKGGVSSLVIWGTSEGFEVTGVASENELIDTQIVEHGVGEFEGEQKPFSRIAVSVVPDASIGRFTANLKIATNDERRAEVTVRVVASVTPDIVATPNRVPVGRMDPGASFTQTLTIRSKSGTKFAILDTQVSGRFKFANEIIEIRPVHPETAEGEPKPSLSDPAAEYTVVISGDAPTGQRMIRADVVLTTDVEDEKEVKIPVFGSIRSQPLGNQTINPNG